MPLGETVQPAPVACPFPDVLRPIIAAQKFFRTVPQVRPALDDLHTTNRSPDAPPIPAISTASPTV